LDGPTLDRPDGMVAVRAERSEEPEPTDAGPGRDTRPGAARGADQDRPLVVTDPERRVAEHLRHRDIVINHEAAHAWDQAVPELRGIWEKIKAKYGYTERSVSVAQPADGSWRGAGERKLDSAQNAEVDRGYDHIREVGEQTIIPGLRAVEAEDPTRHLAGFNHRLKGLDRLKEKVADEIRSTPGITSSQALSVVPDAVRCTYQYDEAAYTGGVRKDVERLEARGFTQVERRNTWSSDQYKGINSRWREPESSVIFEVQFHTRASLEAKELTHKAYERIRSVTATEGETAELKGFQCQVNAEIPIPPGVTEYEDYRPERRNGRRD
jgi:hypothetical protein